MKAISNEIVTSLPLNREIQQYKNCDIDIQVQDLYDVDFHFENCNVSIYDLGQRFKRMSRHMNEYRPDIYTTIFEIKFKNSNFRMKKIRVNTVHFTISLDKSFGYIDDFDYDVIHHHFSLRDSILFHSNISGRNVHENYNSEGVGGMKELTNANRALVDSLFDNEKGVQNAS